MQDETTYMLEPTAFHSMTEAQVLTDQLEQNLSELSNVTANSSRIYQNSATSPPTSSPRSSRCSPKW